MIHILHDSVELVKSVVKDLFSPNHESLAPNKSIQSKPRLEKKECKLVEQSSYQMGNFTIQNHPTLKMKRAGYLGRVVAEQNRTTKVDSYW